MLETIYYFFVYFLQKIEFYSILLSNQNLSPFMRQIEREREDIQILFAIALFLYCLRNLLLHFTYDYFDLILINRSLTKSRVKTVNDEPVLFLVVPEHFGDYE